MSATLWTSSDAATATGGRATSAWTATSVSIDSRTLEARALFVALAGARDGHDFVADAFKRGAAAALVSRRPNGVPENAPLLVVADTQAGLEALGRAARARSSARIVAVTGSAGKTTTKELMRLALGTAGTVAAATQSYNNQWGVPLSLARMAADTRFGVFEIGMNHAGEIRALVKQVRPHVALITTVAPAHLEFFRDVDAIADAKAEIFEGLEHDGAAIIPADNHYAERLVSHARAAGVSRLLTFGSKAGADARLVSAKANDGGQEVVAEIKGKRLAFRLTAPGAHLALNAVAALLVTAELGANLEAAAHALKGFAPLKGRGSRVIIAASHGPVEVIDESYNANPASMAAALDLLASAQLRAGGRRIAVLGDMLELGRDGPALHAALAADIEKARVALVFLCGPQMAALWQALPAACKAAYAKDSAALAPKVAATLRAGDVALVKGSFGSRMNVVIEALSALNSNGDGAEAA